MTLNDSWGFQRADDNWKTPKTIVNNLITCARDGGNYLLNIGPKPDGSIPQESIEILQAVGKWTSRKRRCDLWDRPQRFRGTRLCQLHTAWTHRVCARYQLARGYARRAMAYVLSAAFGNLIRWVEDEGEVRAASGWRQTADVYAGRFVTKDYRPSGDCPRRARHSDCDRV